MMPKDQFFRYHGRSMWPGFQDGDLLELELLPFAHINVGDCLVYRSIRGQAAVHRVVAKGHALVTRGDAMLSIDLEPVTEQQIIGRVIRRHRFGRESFVSGGICGRFAGFFYHYAGRLDPQRHARGGRLACIFRDTVGTVLTPLWKRAVVKRLTCNGDKDLIIWVWGSAVIGSKEASRQQWTIVWPWCLLVRNPVEIEDSRH